MAANTPKVKNQPNTKRDWRMPNCFAQARLLAGGDLRAAAMLYRIRQVWRAPKKLRRCGKEWVAMSRKDWARSSGLSDSEIKNYAIPQLKLKCADFLTFRSWKIRPDRPQKTLWICVDEQAMHETAAYKDAVALASDDYQSPMKGIGSEPAIDPEDGSNVVAFQARKTSAFDHLKTG